MILSFRSRLQVKVKLGKNPCTGRVDDLTDTRIKMFSQGPSGAAIRFNPKADAVCAQFEHIACEAALRQRRNYRNTLGE